MPKLSLNAQFKHRTCSAIIPAAPDPTRQVSFLLCRTSAICELRRHQAVLKAAAAA
jgi:hypothetical protein